MIESEKIGSPIEIRLLTVREAVEQYWESASPLNLTVENDTIVAKIIGDYKILNHSWFVKDKDAFFDLNGSDPIIVKDKKGSQTFSNLGINGDGTYKVICKAHTDIGDVFESVIEVNNLQ